jgi:DNA-binding FrmR family transcriptional regulator
MVADVDVQQRSVVNRLKTARGHLSGVITMVESGAYCPDVMKQLAAVQGLLEAASRLVLRRHLETCVAQAMREGRVEQIVDELMETLKFDRQVLRPAPPNSADTPGHEQSEVTP